jgi:hypothetical protein
MSPQDIGFADLTGKGGPVASATDGEPQESLPKTGKTAAQILEFGRTHHATSAGFPG